MSIYKVHIDNDIIHLKYPADTKLYINNKIEEAVNNTILNLT